MTPNHIEIVRIGGASLLSRRGHDLLDQLLLVSAKLESESDLQGVLLLQDGHVGLGDLGWYDDLEQNILLDDLTERITLLKKVVNRIRVSQVPWYYALNGDCFGGFFEIAMACSERMSFSATARVGFPDILGGVFPYAGFFEISIAPFKKKLAYWADDPVKSVKDVIVHGEINALIESDDVEKLGQIWVEGLLESAKGYSHDLEQSQPIGSKIFARANLSDAAFDTRSFARQFSSSFQACLSLVKSHSSSEKRSRFLTNLCALQLLQKDYTRWLYRNLVCYRPRSKLENQMSIFIDVEKNFPSEMILLNFLKNGGRIVFISEGFLALKRGIEVIYSKISRIVSTEFSEYWENQVYWGVAENVHKQIVLSCVAYDHLMLGRPCKSLSLKGMVYRSYGCSMSLCEIQGANLDGCDLKLRATLECLFDLVIKTNPITSVGMDCSTFVRSKVFELLFNLSRATLRLDEIMLELRNRGWGWLSENTELDSFLSSRHAWYGTSIDGLVMGDWSLDRAIWEVGNIKEANQILESSGGSSHSVTIEEVVERVLLLCGLLARDLKLCGYLGCDSDSDILVSAAIGLPEYEPLPSRRLREIGEPRVLFDSNYYLE